MAKRERGFDPSLPLIPLQEKFCQLYVSSPGISPARCAYLAGYGREATADGKPAHPVQDYFHNAIGKRLMQSDKIQARIAFLRDSLAKQDENFCKQLINTLKDVVLSDPTEYIASQNYTGKFGETRTSFYYKKNWQDIPTHYKKALVDGVDSQGRPKMISKTKAIELLLEVYGMKKESGVLEDLADVFSSAGLMITSPTLGNDISDAELDKYIDGINNDESLLGDDVIDDDVTPPEASTTDSNKEGE
jgi:hypothetical protein